MRHPWGERASAVSIVEMWTSHEMNIYDYQVFKAHVSHLENHAIGHTLQGAKFFKTMLFLRYQNRRLVEWWTCAGRVKGQFFREHCAPKE